MPHTKRKHTEDDLVATAIKRRSLMQPMPTLRMQELTQKAYESLVGIEK